MTRMMKQDWKPVCFKLCFRYCHETSAPVYAVYYEEIYRHLVVDDESIMISKWPFTGKTIISLRKKRR